MPKDFVGEWTSHNADDFRYIETQTEIDVNAGPCQPTLINKNTFQYKQPIYLITLACLDRHGHPYHVDPELWALHKLGVLGLINALRLAQDGNLIAHQRAIFNNGSSAKKNA